MVEVSGFDCGKFWNVQFMSIVIWVGSGRKLPSITPKYGGSLQNFSAPTAGEVVPSNRAKRTKRMSSGKPSVKPRDIRKRHGCFMTGYCLNIRAISKSASRPGMPAAYRATGAVLAECRWCSGR